MCDPDQAADLIAATEDFLEIGSASIQSHARLDGSCGQQSGIERAVQAVQLALNIAI